MEDSITKTCTKCGETFPATVEHFSRDKTRKDGLYPQCKVCRNKYRQANKEVINKRAREHRLVNQKTIRKRDREHYHANKEVHAKYRRKYYQANKDVIIKRTSEYQQANSEYRREYQREYRQANKEALREKRHKYLLEYRRVNKEKRKEYDHQWRKQNPDKVRVRYVRRRARKRQLPDTFTAEQWQRAIEYFNGCCAVCGHQLYDLFGEVVPHADHWIPIANPNCPGTTVENMLPLCNSCNFSKNKTMPGEWLEREYGKRKRKQILERVEKYFEWGVGQS